MKCILSAPARSGFLQQARDDKLTWGPWNRAIFFGEMVLVDNSPRSATAIAEENHTRLVALNQQRFLHLVGQQPAFALTIMHALCMRIRERWELFSDLLKKCGEGGEVLE